MLILQLGMTIRRTKQLINYAAFVFRLSKQFNIISFTLFCFGFWFLETGFLCVALDVLKLALQTQLALNLEICLLLPPKCWDQRLPPPLPGDQLNFYFRISSTCNEILGYKPALVKDHLYAYTSIYNKDSQWFLFTFSHIHLFSLCIRRVG